MKLFLLGGSAPSLIVSFGHSLGVAALVFCAFQCPFLIASFYGSWWVLLCLGLSSSRLSSWQLLCSWQLLQFLQLLQCLGLIQLCVALVQLLCWCSFFCFLVCSHLLYIEFFSIAPTVCPSSLLELLTVPSVSSWPDVVVVLAGLMWFKLLKAL